jgi:hypothetical protein
MQPIVLLIRLRQGLARHATNAVSLGTALAVAGVDEGIWKERSQRDN